MAPAFMAFDVIGMSPVPSNFSPSHFPRKIFLGKWLGEKFDGTGDIPMTSKAMKAGAIEFLEKIFLGKWLGEKFDGTGFHGFRCHRYVAVRGDENNWDGHTVFLKHFLKFQA